MNSFDFTVHKKNSYNLIINEDLSVISNIITKNVPDVSNLILVGGFGRGEGSIISYNNQIIPINDYDIVIISKTNILNRKVHFLKKKILNSISIKHIDIINIKKKNLKKLKKTIFNYDLKYSSHVFYGNIDILNNLPNYNNIMPYSEIKRPLFVYLSALLLSFPKFSEYKDSTPINKFWIYHQICKSILGWSMAKLCLMKGYHSSYLVRNQNFQNFFYNNKIECNLVNIATNFKLKPTLEVPDNLEEIWHINKNIHMNELLLISNNNSFFLQNSNSDILIKKYKFEIKNILKYIYGFLTKNDEYKKNIHLTSAILYLLNLDLKKNKIDTINICRELMKIKLYPKINDINTIVELIKINDPNCQNFINIDNIHK